MSLLRNRYSPQAIPSWENSCLKKVMTMSNDDNTLNTTESFSNDSEFRNFILPQLTALERMIRRIKENSSTAIFSKTEAGELKLLDPLLWKLLGNLPDIEDLKKVDFDNEYIRLYTKMCNQILAPICFKARNFKNWRGNDVLYPEGKNPLVVGELANTVAFTMFSLTSEDDFVVAQRNREERAKHQLNRSEKLINGLRQKQAKLLVIRIDLAIHSDYRDDHGCVTFIQNSFKKFMKRTYSMQEKIVGYIWKLEYGKQKGYHYHTLIFLDGNYHQKDQILADEFGKVWLEVSKGKGTYFSANAVKEKYKNLAIGMLRHDDDKAFKALLTVIKYFAKDEQFAATPVGHRIRTFGTSQMPASKRKSGRPRRGT